jgi:predicted porin
LQYSNWQLFELLAGFGFILINFYGFHAMKKSLLALALMSAFSGAAMAQSNIIIYGLADVGLQNLKNGNPAGSTTSLSSGQVQGSRLGFKGTEDLGDGLKANFELVEGISIDTGTSGQGGRAFGRKATVGLSGDFGSVDLGRDKTINNLFIDSFDPFASGFINSGNGLSSLYFFGFNTPITQPAGASLTGPSAGRVNNAIFYNTPNWDGFRGSADYSFGEVAGDNKLGSSYGVTLRYTNFGFDVGYSYSLENQQVGSTNINNKRSANTFAISYKFGIFTPVFIYEKQKADLAYTGFTGNTDQKNFSLAGNIQFDAANSVKLEYTKITDDTVISAARGTVGDAKQFGIGYQHNLSKRTDLYVAYANTTQDANSKKAGAAANGADVKELTFGIRHKF